jgi:alpha-L-rhamnosidase
VPWVLNQRTGDVGVLRRQFDSMTAWVEQVHALTGGSGLWNTGFQLGDWLDPEAPPDAPDRARTDRYLVATGYHAHSTRITAEVARILGRAPEAEHFSQLAHKSASAFRNEWVAPSGRLVSDTPTALALAIEFGLLDRSEQYRAAGRRLLELVREGDHLIKTGFVGTPLLCDALASSGFMDDAYHMILQERCPSWLYPVTMGATTIWERWDSMLPDGQINPGEMTSFNHYALGAVADFLHRKVAGLAPAAPGYREVEIAPVPGGGLTSAKTSHLSPYGRIAVSWTRRDEAFTLDVELPAQVTAKVSLPGEHGSRRLEGPGAFQLRARTRPADLDPERPRTVNLHDPSQR